MCVCAASMLWKVAVDSNAFCTADARIVPLLLLLLLLIVLVVVLLMTAALWWCTAVVRVAAVELLELRVALSAFCQ